MHPDASSGDRQGQHPEDAQHERPHAPRRRLAGLAAIRVWRHDDQLSPPLWWRQADLGLALGIERPGDLGAGRHDPFPAHDRAVARGRQAALELEAILVFTRLPLAREQARLRVAPGRL
jgi:hypothetical protein